MEKKQIISYFTNRYTLNKEQQLYLAIHAKRYQTVLSWLADKQFNRVLDIGPSYLSELLQNHLQKPITLMGFDAEESVGGHLPSLEILSNNHFIQQNLNDWATDAQSPKYDLIICGEILEHLYSAPQKLFQNLYKSLNTGGFLILQTPNAVALRKRISLLIGINPFEMPRENQKNPGHYREYTPNELRKLARANGFCIQKLILDEYFEYPSWQSKVYRNVKSLIPANLRSGITIILQKK